MFTKTIRKTITVAAVLMAVPASALAIPNNGGTGNGEPQNQPPTPRFTISPNPAIVSSQPVVAHTRTVGAGGQTLALQSGDVVTFNASATTDDTGIDSYRWDLGTGSYVDGNKIQTKRFYSTGSFTIKLLVTDTDGASRIVSHTLIVHRAPHAALTADNPAVLVGQTVNYSAAGSTGDPGLDGTYKWDLDGDGTFEKTTNVPTIATSYSTLGNRTVHVQVTDTYGKTSTTALNEVVHRAPTAAFTANPNPAVVGQAVTFDGSTSTDDDPIAKYEWDLDGNGTFETDTQAVPTAKATFNTPGTVTIKLRVTDDHGVQDVVSHTLTVNPAPTTTTTTTTDTTAPLVRITPRSAKLAKSGFVTIKVTCPAGETSCAGNLSLRTLGAHTSAVGGAKKFTAAGGQTARIKVKLTKAQRRAIKHGKRLRTQATATATDAAGNTGTSKALVVIHR